MLLRWDPFRELDRLSEEMWKGVDTGPMRIPMDAIRTGDTVEMHFEMPGLDPEAISVDVDRDVVTVSAERTVSTERKEGEEVLVRERRHGRFMRQVTLGDNLDADRLDARYDDGVLTVRVPVSERAKSRRVEISRGRPDGSAAIEASTASEPTSDDDGHTHAA
jgi:HSP20 family protein